MHRLCSALVSVAVASGMLQAGEAGAGIQADDGERGSGNFGVFWDNDVVAGQDSNYTNGLRFSWVSGTRFYRDLNGFDRVLAHVVGVEGENSWWQSMVGFDGGSKIVYQRGLALSQYIYTPEDEYAPVPKPGERPYAGWLGGGYALHAKSPSVFNSVELELGVIGPSARAREVQQWMHNIQGIYQFQGWDTQIPDEVTGNLYFTHRRRLNGLTRAFENQSVIDSHFDVRVALGTFKANASVGMMTRYGWGITDALIETRASQNAQQVVWDSGKWQSGTWGSYLIAGGRVTAVAHDATLDGPVFRSYDTGVQKETWVVEGFAGVGFRYRKLDFGYVHTLRSDTFRTQTENGSYGTLFVSVTF
ncbi:lipid A deacylase LpxR family protein [Rubritalea tangerina]|uniref:Lipid A deacylase LpxR family protein n=1 Tax=Rubritalea tangerina TaxID=430798 RepID=A0ABW4ZAM0_9BACT